MVQITVTKMGPKAVDVWDLNPGELFVTQSGSVGVRGWEHYVLLNQDQGAFAFTRGHGPVREVFPYRKGDSILLVQA